MPVPRDVLIILLQQSGVLVDAILMDKLAVPSHIVEFAEELEPEIREAHSQLRIDEQREIAESN